MTKELESQRTELVTTNRQLTERRRFMEAVLSGVSAGVIGLDRHGCITLVSRSAEKLLGRDGAELIGRPLADVVPEFADLVQAADPSARSRRQQQIALLIDGEERSFSVRVTEQAPSEEDHGSVVTFDDITELVSAQRTSAWADVARRIAHEIKNPLTPIQLSAERLRRKYAAAITEDRETFDRCTETIIRQVGDVTRMVDEFSAFARSPKPQMEDHDIRDVVKAAVHRPPDGEPRHRLRHQGRQGAHHRHLRPAPHLPGRHQPREERPGSHPAIRGQEGQGAGLVRDASRPTCAATATGWTSR